MTTRLSILLPLLYLRLYVCCSLRRYWTSRLDMFKEYYYVRQMSEKETEVDVTDDTEKKLSCSPSGYNSLVLSGGAVRGLAIIGALQYAYDNFLLKNVKFFFGTSVGAIICYLLVIGYTPGRDDCLPLY